MHVMTINGTAQPEWYDVVYTMVFTGTAAHGHRPSYHRGVLLLGVSPLLLWTPLDLPYASRCLFRAYLCGGSHREHT